MYMFRNVRFCVRKNWHNITAIRYLLIFLPSVCIPIWFWSGISWVIVIVNGDGGAIIEQDILNEHLGIISNDMYLPGIEFLSSNVFGGGGGNGWTRLIWKTIHFEYLICVLFSQTSFIQLKFVNENFSTYIANWCNLLTWWHRNGTIARTTFAGLPTWMTNRIIWRIMRWNLRWNDNWRSSILSRWFSKCSSITSFQLNWSTSKLRRRWWFCCWWWTNSIWLRWNLNKNSI